MYPGVSMAVSITAGICPVAQLPGLIFVGHAPEEHETPICTLQTDEHMYTLHYITLHYITFT